MPVMHGLQNLQNPQTPSKWKRKGKCLLVEADDTIPCKIQFL